MRRASITIVAVLLLLGYARPAHAQGPVAPSIRNGRLEARAGGDLGAVVRAVPAGAGDVTWVGYAVPADGSANRCCWNGPGDTGICCQGCRLEREDGVMSTDATRAGAVTPARPVPLEPATHAVVLVRVAAGAVDRIRVFSPSCVLDAGGRTVVWLGAIAADTSVAWLHAQAVSGRRRLADDAVMALAAHAAPAALDQLITFARQGDTVHLRGQALFWLAQRAGARAVGVIAEAVDRDPDTDVKRRAVFALSQLPPDDGVPRLIDIARDHSNAAVRRQAFFWLGQSKDTRALAFFSEILKR